MKLHPNARRPGLFIHAGINIGHTPPKLSVRQIGKGYFRFLSQFHVGEILLVILRLHPDQREICQSVEFHAGIDHLAINGHLFHHHAGTRGIDTKSASDFAVPLQLGYLIV